MTGEVTIRGRVLPIGGLKEKILAAHRAEIFEVIFPKDNEKDLKDIPERVMKSMTVYPVSHMDEVLQIALEDRDLFNFVGEPSQAIDWRIALKLGKEHSKSEDEESSTIRTH